VLEVGLKQVSEAVHPGVRAGSRCTYNLSQTRSGCPGQGFSAVPSPVGRGVGWRSQVQLVRAVKACGCLRAWPGG